MKKKLLQLDFHGRKTTKDATRIAETELVSLAKKLYDDLSQDIFEKVTVDKMELTRNVCDLKTIAENIEKKGSILVGTLSADMFVKSAKQITHTLHEVPDKILKENYRTFLNILQDHLKTKKKSKFDSKELIKDFLNTELHLDKGVEVTIQAICAAAIKKLWRSIGEVSINLESGTSLEKNRKDCSLKAK